MDRASFKRCLHAMASMDGHGWHANLRLHRSIDGVVQGLPLHAEISIGAGSTTSLDAHLQIWMQRAFPSGKPPKSLIQKTNAVLLRTARALGYSGRFWGLPAGWVLKRKLRSADQFQREWRRLSTLKLTDTGLICT